MVDLLLSPLGPGLILVFAGGLLRAVARLRRASLLALMGLGPLGLSLLLLTWLRLSQVPPLEAMWWPLATSPVPVRWSLDGWNWLGSVLLVLTGTTALLLTWRLPGLRTGAFHGLSLLLLAAAITSTVSANLLALSGAWVATDILIITRARGSRPTTGAAPVALLAGSSLLVMVAIGITSLSAATAPWDIARLSSETTALLLVAAALRMAAYPFHLWLGPGGVIRDRGTHWLVSGAGLITGAWLIGRLPPQGIAYWLRHPVWVPIAAAALLAAGIAAWSNTGRDRFAMLTSSRATWLWLAPILVAAPLARDALGWALLAVVLGMTLLVVGRATTLSWGWRVPLFLSIAILAGLPLTAGLAARSLIPSPNPFFWLLLVLGEGLALACVFATWHPQAEEPLQPAVVAAPEHAPARLNWPVIRLLAAFALATVPTILWGLRPEALAGLAGFSQSPAFTDLVGRMTLGQWLGVALSLGVGYGLAWALRQGHGEDAAWELWRERLANATSLNWALDLARWGLTWLDNVWRLVVSIAEGEGYLGWLILLLLLAWLVIQP